MSSLHRIHRSYEVPGYRSFKECIKAEWKLSVSHGNKLIKASEAYGNLLLGENAPTGVNSPPQMPTSERQVRPITDLNDDPELQQTIWNAAVETAPEGEVTEVHVKAIKEDMVTQGKKNPEFLKLMEERTGYKRATVGQFLRAHHAMNNLIDFCPDKKAAMAVFPDSERQIRPLATKKLNEDPELQAEIWTEVVEEAGEGPITAKMVKDKVKEKWTLNNLIDYTEDCKIVPRGTKMQMPGDECIEDCKIVPRGTKMQ